MIPGGFLYSSFSVGLPASCIAAAEASLALLSRTEVPRQQLAANIARFRRGLVELGVEGPERSSSAILSLVIGDEGKLRALVRDLFERGVWAEPLSFPAVARGEERLRFRVTSSHTEKDIDRSLAEIAGVLQEHGLVTSRRRPSAGRRAPAGPYDGRENAELAARSAAVSGSRS